MSADLETLKLYEIADELAAVTNRLIENDGVLTPELEEAWDRMEGAFEHKAERTALVIQTLTRKAEAANAERKRLKALARSRERAAENLKEYLRSQMRRLDRERIDAPRATIWRQRNGRPSITWTRDAEALPDAFRRVRVEADTQAAYENLKAGEDLPDGFRVERGEHLRIR